MIESKEKEFESAKGRVFITVQQLDGMKGSAMFLRLTKRFAPLLADAKSKSKAELIGDLVGALDVAEFESVTRDLLKGRCLAKFPEADLVDSNAGDNLGSIFQGHPFEVFKLVAFALEVNFGDFSKLLNSLGLSK